MNPKYWKDESYTSLEALAQNGKNVEVIAAMEEILRPKLGQNGSLS